MARLASFAELPLEPTLARALADKGYETATPVQAAVLDPALAGRDLLVSSQTGSGKTIAFGTLIGERLLPAPARPGPAPRALVVAPTRELAAQVSRELRWLFAVSGTRLGAFTGGTAIGGDLRRLRAGVDIAVGTPGRLVDLHKRQALDLSAVAVLVIDEADEMFDLGFKEDLEYLLASAPPERRTLLFSATLPREIERLAATYQRAAARIDARPGRGPHEDIRYLAYLVRAQDRLAAVVNVLLAAGEAKAIVFCRTREAVGALHQRLVDHRLAAAAISGERAQGERDRALEALRAGTARVLVATNVAARGLDLPDVDLVVHADLPENTDSLTHRSGRTGRAGKKGTSVVIADLAERRKAERLLAGAGLKVAWAPPPTEVEVRGALEERLVASLVAEAHTGASPPGGTPPPSSEALVDRLRAVLPERILVSLLLAREARRLPVALPLEPVDLARREQGPRLPARARVGADARPAPPDGRGWTEAVIFRVNLGAEAKAEPGWLLPLICRRGGVTRREVGAIRVGPRSSTFEIAAAAAPDFALASSQPDPRAPHVTIEPVHNVRPPGPPRAPERGAPARGHAKSAPRPPHRRRR
jgi:ATP-dependent RNA helicase DeaD